MKDKNKDTNTEKITSKGLAVLLVFSLIITVIAFAVACKEHSKISDLSVKYDEAISKIDNCQDAINALIMQIESSEYKETTTELTAQPSETTVDESSAANEVSETNTSEAATADSKTEETTTTTKAPDSSGLYFVTQSGKKYHVGSCSYLEKSKIAISWDRIKSEGYSPCSRCIK